MSTHAVPADGCAINNGGCQIFCFSVPNTEGEGTQVQCGCPTGIIIKPDNTCNVCKFARLMYVYSLVYMHVQHLYMCTCMLTLKLVSVLL